MSNKGTDNQEKIFAHQIKLIKERRKKYKRDPVIGEVIHVNNIERKKYIEIILHRPKNINSITNLPVYFNMHGGGWLAGDARSMETYCSFLCNNLGIIVVNVNYTKIDEEKLPYATEEVVDVVNYFIENSEYYNCNPKKFIVGGFSAGGQIAATAALQLKEQGIQLAGQLLCYPCVSLANDDIEKIGNQNNTFKNFVKYFFPKGENNQAIISPLQSSENELKGLPTTIVIVSGKDPLKYQGIEYGMKLINAGVHLKFKEYADALHGFIEVNQPEHSPRKEGQSMEQKKFCEEAMNYIALELDNCFKEVGEHDK